MLSEFEKIEIERRIHQEKLMGCEEKLEKDCKSHGDDTVNSYVSDVIDFDVNISSGNRLISNNEFEPVVVCERVDSFLDGHVSRPISDEETQTLRRIREIFYSDDTVDIPTLKGKDKWIVSKYVSLVNGLLHNVQIDVNVSTVNRLLYAGSFVVCEKLGLIKKKSKKSDKPWWQRRLESSIQQWRKDLGRITEIHRGQHLKPRILDELERKYKVTERGTTSVSVFLRNKIQAGSTKIRFYIQSQLSHRQNTLFRNNQSQLYKELGGVPKISKETPDPEDAQRFWNNIWSPKGKFNVNASWINDYENFILEPENELEEMEDVTISTEDLKEGISRMANWKAPGPDGVRGFWFKKFVSVHPKLVKALERCVSEGNVPEWMVKGRTVLIQKDPAKGTAPSNYRPITCLPIMWKLLTGIFSGKIYHHLDANGLLPFEQKGFRKRSKGTKDQLLIDKAVLRKAKLSKRYLSMAWIDYRKAFDMVPHEWILKILKITKVAGNIGSFIENTMGNWKTVLHCNGQALGSVNINRGIFQGDSLSPLLFVMTMLPLSFLLKREKFGFDLNGCLINHLFFMDDLKLYAKTERELKELIAIVDAFSQDIGMTFGLDKCASLIMKKGVRVRSCGIDLPSGDSIKELEEEGYKYLGVLQECTIKQKRMKEIVRQEYLRRVKAVAKSKLYCRNLFTAINAWAVSVIRYPAGVLDWTEMELKEMDIKTRKILTLNGVFHKKGNVDRLYLKRDEGGRGLISVEDCVKMEVCNLKA